MIREPSWRTGTPADPADARRRLLDATESCLLRHGVGKTTVGDVAVEAGVSRATVYRYVTDRDELLLGVVLRKARTYLGWLGGRHLPRGHFGDALVEGVLLTVDAARADELLGLLFTPEHAGSTGAIAGASDALFALAADFLRPLFRAAQERGELRPDLDLDDAAEWAVRTVLSLLAVAGPRQRDRSAQRSFLHAFLVPAICGPRPAGRAPRAGTGSPAPAGGDVHGHLGGRR